MKQEKILTDEKGKKYKITEITNVEGRSVTYVEKVNFFIFSFRLSSCADPFSF